MFCLQILWNGNYFGPVFAATMPLHRYGKLTHKLLHLPDIFIMCFKETHAKVFYKNLHILIFNAVWRIRVILSGSATPVKCNCSPKKRPGSRSGTGLLNPDQDLNKPQIYPNPDPVLDPLHYINLVLLLLTKLHGLLLLHDF